MKIKLCVGIFLLISMLMQVSIPDASAQEAKFEVKASATIYDILKDRTGKRTAIRTQSGEDIEGTVATVGDSVVHVTQLTGKEFYDAVIRIDRIDAVILRVRNR